MPGAPEARLAIARRAPRLSDRTDTRSAEWEELRHKRMATNTASSSQVVRKALSPTLPPRQSVSASVMPSANHADGPAGVSSTPPMPHGEASTTMWSVAVGVGWSGMVR